jgi:hypothetical protein
MVACHHIYDSLAEFMVTLNPEKVLNFFAPAQIRQHVESLVD